MKIDIHAVNPYIRVAMQSVLSANTEIGRRVIFDYELIYIERGEFTLNYNECDYKCSKGQFILLRPGVSHSFTEINNDLSQPHRHFDVFYSSKSAKVPICFKDMCDLTPDERYLLQEDIFEDYPQIPLISFNDKEKVLSLFYEVIYNTESILLRKAKFTKILDAIIKDNFPDVYKKEENHYGVARQLKDYIDSGQGLSTKLSDFAKRFSYSKYYLERQFKKHYGINIISYRNAKKMEAAEQMLKTQTVSNVSEKLGFSSIYVFSRAYKQHYGISPSEVKRLKQPH